MKRSFIVFSVLLAFASLMILVYGCGTVGGGTPAYVPRVFFIHSVVEWDTPECVSTDLEGGDWQTIVENRGIGTSWMNHISLSPNGSKVFLLSAISGLATLEVMDPNGSDIEVIETASNVECPAWAGDSQRIAFVSNKDGGNKLYVKPLGGGAADPISSASVNNPSFSKDRTYIAYVKSGDIWYRNADGSGSEMQVTSSSSYEGIPIFSPEDDNVLIFGREDGSDVYLYKVSITNTLGAVRLNDGEPFNDLYDADSESAVWSDKEPLHVYVAGERSGDSNSRIYRVPVSGGTPEALTEDSYFCVDLRTFKGVNGIYYTRTNGLYPDVYRMAFDGSSQTRVTSNESADYFNNQWYP